MSWRCRAQATVVPGFLHQGRMPQMNLAILGSIAPFIVVVDVIGVVPWLRRNRDRMCHECLTNVWKSDLTLLELRKALQAMHIAHRHIYIDIDNYVNNYIYNIYIYNIQCIYKYIYNI